MDEKQMSVTIESVRSQFAEWRAHKSRRDRIPERLRVTPRIEIVFSAESCVAEAMQDRLSS